MDKELLLLSDEKKAELWKQAQKEGSNPYNDFTPGELMTELVIQAQAEISFSAGKQVGFEVGIEQGKAEGIRQGFEKGWADAKKYDRKQKT